MPDGMLVKSQIECPKSPYDHDIALLTEKDELTDVELARACAIVILRYRTSYSWNSAFTDEQNILFTDLWHQNYSDFDQFVRGQAVTGPLGNLGMLRLILEEIDSGYEHQRPILEALIEHAQEQVRSQYNIPEFPQREEIESLLVTFCEWGDAEINKAVDLEIAYRAWENHADPAWIDSPHADEIIEMMRLPFDLLTEAIRLAPAQTVRGCQAKLRMLEDHHAKNYDSCRESEVLKAVQSDLNRILCGFPGQAAPEPKPAGKCPN